MAALENRHVYEWPDLLSVIENGDASMTTRLVAVHRANMCFATARDFLSTLLIFEKFATADTLDRLLDIVGSGNNMVVVALQLLEHTAESSKLSELLLNLDVIGVLIGICRSCDEGLASAALSVIMTLLATRPAATIKELSKPRRIQVLCRVSHAAREATDALCTQEQQRIRGDAEHKGFTAPDQMQQVEMWQSGRFAVTLVPVIFVLSSVLHGSRAGQKAILTHAADLQRDIKRVLDATEGAYGGSIPIGESGVRQLEQFSAALAKYAALQLRPESRTGGGIGHR